MIKTTISGEKMVCKIKTISVCVEEMEFDRIVNEFCKDKRVKATQTHVNLTPRDKDDCYNVWYTAIIYYEE